MRRLLAAVLVLLGVALLSGMGSLGGAPEGTVNKTGENVRVQIVDRSGVTTNLAWFSMDGKLYLAGRRGEGEMNVVFKDLKEVSFGPLKGDVVTADLLLKSGSRHQLKVDKDVKFSGDTGYGSYWITANDISRIIFR
jgi:hypothetical protein